MADTPKTPAPESTIGNDAKSAHGGAGAAAGGAVKTDAPGGAGHGEHPEPSKMAAQALAARAAAKVVILRVFASMKDLGGFFKNLGKRPTMSIKDFFVGILNLPMLFLRGDLTTRVLAVGFVASVALLGLTATQLYHRFGSRIGAHTGKDPGHEAAERLLEEQEKLQILAANVVFLERFAGRIATKTEKQNAFEVELYVEANAPETATQIRSHLPQIREIVSMTLENQNYDDLISDEGKVRLKEHLIDALNKVIEKWGHEARVKKVYFTKFIMG